MNKVRPAGTINTNLKWFLGQKKVSPSHKQEDNIYE